MKKSLSMKTTLLTLFAPEQVSEWKTRRKRKPDFYAQNIAAAKASKGWLKRINSNKATV